MQGWWEGGGCEGSEQGPDPWVVCLRVEKLSLQWITAFSSYFVIMDKPDTHLYLVVMEDVLCSGPNAGEHITQTRYFIHIITRGFLINKGNTSLRLDAKKPYWTVTLCRGMGETEPAPFKGHLTRLS